MRAGPRRGVRAPRSRRGPPPSLRRARRRFRSRGRAGDSSWLGHRSGLPWLERRPAVHDSWPRLQSLVQGGVRGWRCFGTTGGRFLLALVVEQLVVHGGEGSAGVRDRRDAARRRVLRSQPDERRERRERLELLRADDGSQGRDGPTAREARRETRAGRHPPECRPFADLVSNGDRQAGRDDARRGPVASCRRCPSSFRWSAS